MGAAERALQITDDVGQAHTGRVSCEHDLEDVDEALHLA